MGDSYFSSYFLGLFLADGNFNNGLVEINSKDSSFLNDVESQSELEFIIDNRNNQDMSRIRTSNSFVKTFLRYHGVKEGSKHSNLPYPSKIDEKYFYSFLAGYFDGDGSVSFSEDGKVGIQFTSNSRKFLEKIRKKLNDKMGVRGSFYEYSNKESYKIRYAKSESKLILEKIEKFVMKDKDRVEKGLEKLNSIEKKRWTEKEELYLKKNFEDVKNEKIASELSRSVNSVKSKATRLGLR